MFKNYLNKSFSREDITIKKRKEDIKFKSLGIIGWNSSFNDAEVVLFHFRLNDIFGTIYYLTNHLLNPGLFFIVKPFLKVDPPTHYNPYFVFVIVGNMLIRDDIR